MVETLAKLTRVALGGRKMNRERLRETNRHPVRQTEKDALLNKPIVH